MLLLCRGLLVLEFAGLLPLSLACSLRLCLPKLLAPLFAFLLCLFALLLCHRPGFPALECNLLCLHLLGLGRCCAFSCLLDCFLRPLFSSCLLGFFGHLAENSRESTHNIEKLHVAAGSIRQQA